MRLFLLLLLFQMAVMAQPSSNIFPNVQVTTNLDAHTISLDQNPILAFGGGNINGSGTWVVSTINPATANVGTLNVTNAITAGSLSTQTNVTSAEIVATNGMTLNGTRITSWPSGGGGIAQTVSNNIVSNGLLAVDSTKTNGVAATAAMVTSALGYTPQTGAQSLTNLGTTYTSATGFLNTWSLISQTGAWGVAGAINPVTANTTYFVLCYCNRTFTIAATTWYIGATDSGKHLGLGLYDLAGNRLWYDVVSTTSSGKVNQAATGYTIQPGFYYLTYDSDSASATSYGHVMGGSDAIIFCDSLGLKSLGTAANASSAGVPPATLGALTVDSAQKQIPLVRFD